MEKVDLRGFTELNRGWVRLSIHPTTTDAEMQYVCNALLALADHAKEWKKTTSSKRALLPPYDKAQSGSLVGRLLVRG